MNHAVRLCTLAFWIGLGTLYGWIFGRFGVQS